MWRYLHGSFFWVLLRWWLAPAQWVLPGCRYFNGTRNQGHQYVVFGSPSALAHHLPFPGQGNLCDRGESLRSLPRVGPSVLARKKVSLFFPGRDLSAAGETWASASHWVIYLERTFRTSLQKEAAHTQVTPAGSTEFREHSEWNWHTFGKVQMRTLMENGGEKKMLDYPPMKSQQDKTHCLLGFFVVEPDRIKHFNTFKQTLINQHRCILNSRAR